MAETINTIGSGTVQGAIQYLDFLSSKGHVTPGATSALKTGFSKVAKTVGGDGWQTIQIREIDVDDYMHRFANMTHGQYNAKSLVDYKSRVKKVTTWYLEFLTKPGWVPPLKARKRSGKHITQDDFSDSDAADSLALESTIAILKPAPSPASNSNLIAFPFPLSDGGLATLYLPRTLSRADAVRMARHIETLVADELEGKNNE